MADLRSPRDRELGIREEYGTKPHRLYSSTSLFCAIPASPGPHTFDISFPIEISLYSASTIISAIMEGDEAELHIGGETQVAANVAPVDIGATVIPVNSVEYIKVGFWAFIQDETNRDVLGRVIDIDETTNQITVETATTHAFAAGKAVKIQMKMGHTIKFAGVGAVNFGQAMIGGSPIPANTNIHVEYKNNQGDAKNLMLLLEYRY